MFLACASSVKHFRFHNLEGKIPILYLKLLKLLSSIIILDTQIYEFLAEKNCGYHEEFIWSFVVGKQLEKVGISATAKRLPSRITPCSWFLWARIASAAHIKRTFSFRLTSLCDTSNTTETSGGFLKRDREGRESRAETRRSD